MYVPTLKTRAAEFTTLSGIAGADVLPLFEFIEHDRRGVASELLYAFEQIATTWAAPFLMDLRLLSSDPANRTLAWQLTAFWLGKQPQLHAAPSIDLFDDSAVVAAAGAVAAHAGAAAIRVEAGAVPATQVAVELGRVVGQLGLARDRIVLLLDWRDLPFERSLPDLERDTRALAAAAGSGWARVVVLGTGAGPTPAHTARTAPPARRREWWLWLQLHHNSGGLPQQVTFGDYGGYPAPAPGNGRGTIPTIRYSTANGQSIYRERTDKTLRIGGLHLAAADLVASGTFFGPRFSAGDLAIGAAAADPSAIGRAEDWRTMSLQHHVALVLRDVVAVPPPPPPGTL